TINGSPWLLSLGNEAPHPKAAQVFANWILSKEGLETYARGYGSATLRTDIYEAYLNPGNLPKAGVKYFDDTDWEWIVTGRHDSREKGWKILKGEKGFKIVQKIQNIQPAAIRSIPLLHPPPRQQRGRKEVGAGTIGTAGTF